jgi:hypothetical protein
VNDTFYGEGIEWGGRRVGVGHGVFNEICPTFCLYPYFSQEIQHLDRRLHPKPKEKGVISCCLSPTWRYVHELKAAIKRVEKSSNPEIQFRNMRSGIWSLP